jgi:hypothetical protein
VSAATSASAAAVAAAAAAAAIASQRLGVGSAKRASAAKSAAANHMTKSRSSTPREQQGLDTAAERASLSRVPSAADVVKEKALSRVPSAADVVKEKALSRAPSAADVVKEQNASAALSPRLTTTDGSLVPSEVGKGDMPKLLGKAPAATPTWANAAAKPATPDKKLSSSPTTSASTTASPSKQSVALRVQNAAPEAEAAGTAAAAAADAAAPAAAEFRHKEEDFPTLGGKARIQRGLASAPAPSPSAWGAAPKGWGRR